MTSSITEEQWQAIITNDASFDVVFLYGVRTTGIFCRPSCKSPNPKREYVRIFQNAQQALAEGFRPCKRCKPCEQRMPDEEWVLQIKAVIDTHYHEPLTLALLAEHCHGSPYYLQRTFKRIMNMSPADYIQRIRIHHAKQKLMQTNQSIADIGVKVGLPNTSYFITLFKQYTGKTPKQFRLAFQIQQTEK
ncbi:bifunctional transcriptional activator/DNA repair enzyme AdaA [Virgibacillus pantothenticus]|uniref:bifunctional transcriptional activator/DNA repair enzyme AdaA n=1 Tax=Virgibacillus pantothenticus TaxID=1473 RepID=UPI001C23A010|nr:bifunctional transcriptional activator/DNA repair enzyme AdaA [Virgibacillus pantothenticus]MBU8568565.1 bifunctional transcriptional activator/DNA repair enzyme AdaA [Virgibacillus pantothenticus]MBU8602607.1 bifunctional transcriptional activator/DNA repair enzyme AdaA [Virgibacillus pantothenticus]MBU8636727.1 bifunctional transcriptional activator/DNA repair enzyme AdaA [Virgibacillus pantothenticus]MBU8644406.1 bifunctional transcriptional activator/DNA repair enzyme AdaA [Virgibacillus